MTIATALRLPRETSPHFAVIEIEFFDEAVAVGSWDKLRATGKKDKGLVNNICSYLRRGELRTVKRPEAVQ